MRRCALLLAIQAFTVHAWRALPQHVLASRFSHQVRPRCLMQHLPDQSDVTPAAATGKDTPKTNGIPNYMIRTSGTIGYTVVTSIDDLQDEGMAYEKNSLVTIMTKDVMDMVQERYGDYIDYLGENIFVEDMLFDDFKAGDTFEIGPPERAAEKTTEVLERTSVLEIVEARPSSALDLSELDGDDSKKDSISSLLSSAPGLSGWTAKVVKKGLMGVGFTITKRIKSEAKSE